MKRKLVIKTLVSFLVVSSCFSALAGGGNGNGNEPPLRGNSTGESVSFCEKYPLLCSIFSAGGGNGNGNEPPE